MKNPEHIPVIIIGGGPVGLFLAICLLKKGIECKVLEMRKNPVPDSRSLGIHPVSLELFDEVGISEAFLEKGLKIRKGIALTENKVLGEITFDHCPKPHNYILMCPQFTTEKILRDELNKLNENVLVTGAEFQRFQEKDNFVEIEYSLPSNAHQQITSSYLIGCDGKNSLVRQQASIHFSGKRYDDTYIMGDFEDTTDFGRDAAVFLTKEGLIESFPQPNGMRRWVVKTDSYISKPTHNKLAELVKNRIGYDLFPVNSTMLSGFGVQHFIAETFAKGRILLAGDAAHVVSPIGGQGMNLGWLGAWKLAKKLSALKNSRSVWPYAPAGFNSYTNNQQKMVRKAARRSEFNMSLGRKPALSFLRNLLVQGILKTPLQKKTAEIFTMRGLENWWV